MKKLIFTLLLCLCFHTSFSQEIRSFQSKGKYGFKKGETIVIPATFDYLSEFKEGIALAKTQNKWGYLKSDGKWLIEPQFDRVQPFVDGFSFMKNGNKLGLISSSGDIIRDAIYDSIQQDYNSFFFYKNGNKHAYLKSWKKVVKIDYELVESGTDWSYGQKQKSFDIYYKGKLVYENSERIPEFIYFTEGFIDVSKNGKVGLIDSNANFLIPLDKYSDINLENVPQYTWKNNYYSTLIKGTSIIDIELESYNYDLFRRDLSQMNSKPITYFELVENQFLEMKSSDQIVTISDDGKLNIFKYTFFQSYGSNHLGILPNGEAELVKLVRQDTIVLAKFPAVQPIQEENYAFDENGEPTGEIIYTSHDDIYVFESNKSERKKIFNTATLEDITDFSISERFIDNIILCDNGNYFVIGDLESGKFNIWKSGEKPVTTFTYDVITSLIDNHILVKEDSKSRIINLLNLKEIVLSDTVEVRISTNDYHSVLVQTDDPDYESGYYATDVKIFNIPFMYLKNSETGKISVIDYLGTVHAGKYDSIIPMPSVNGYEIPFIKTQKNGLWGVINLINGTEIYPNYEKEINFTSNDLDWSNYNEKYFYALYDNFEESFYFNEKCQKVEAIPNFEELIFKSKGLYGTEGYSISEKNQSGKVTLIEAKYKKLERLEINDWYIATNKQKLKGIINGFGDTILPFEYSDFKTAELYFDIGETFLGLYCYKKVKKKTLVGLMNLHNQKMIPCKYDEIQLEECGDFSPKYLVKLNGKFGFYNTFLEEVVACEFDELFFQTNEDYVNGMAIHMQCLNVVKNRKMYITTFSDYSIKIDPMQYNIGFDLIANNNGFVKKGLKWFAYDLSLIKMDPSNFNNEAIETTLEEIIKSDIGEGLKLTYKNEKLGILNTNTNKVLVPETLQFVIFTEDQMLIKFEKGKKYYVDIYTNTKYPADKW